MQAESFNHIDLSGLFTRKVQFLCLCILCLGIGAMTLMHQQDLLFNKISKATLKARSDQVTMTTRDGLSYPLYTYQGYKHQSLFSHRSTDPAIYVVPHTHIFYSAYEVHHYKAVLSHRLCFILGSFAFSLLFYILYRKTPFQP